MTGPAAFTHGPAAMQPAPASVRNWLIVVAAMIFFMIVIGALTRLTESGLSMVEWRPVTGWLPPMSDAAWQAELQKYLSSPQGRLINRGFTVAEFKQIFWLEFIHRLWGRLIGVAFAVPLAWFCPVLSSSSARASAQPRGNTGSPDAGLTGSSSLHSASQTRAVLCTFSSLWLVSPMWGPDFKLVLRRGSEAGMHARC